jgi:hypothetical protein
LKNFFYFLQNCSVTFNSIKNDLLTTIPHHLLKVFLYRLFCKRSALFLFNKVIIVSIFTLFFANNVLADYTINAGSTTDPATTPALLNATGTISIYGTMAINSNVTFTSSTPLTIFIYGTSGQIYWYANKTLALPAGSTITFINNPTAPPGLQPTTGSASQILQIGTVKYAAANDNSNNVVYSFSQLNSIGGTSKVSPAATTPTICFGSSINLSANPLTPSGNTIKFTWITSPVSGTFSDNNTNTATSTTLSGLAANIYTVTCQLYSTAGGSIYYLVASDSITITVNPLPAAPTSVTASPASICTGSSSNISATTSADSIKWYTVSTGGTSIGSSISGSNFPVSPASTSTYYAEGKINATRCSSSSRNPVVVSVSPTSVGGTLPSLSACSTGSGTLTLSGNVGNVTQWENSINSGTTWTVIANTSTTLSLTITSQTTLYKALVQSGACSSTYSAIAIVGLHDLWSGATSTDWYTVSNWSDNQLPSTSCPALTIPGSLTNYPLLSSGTGTVNNITIQSGASLTVTSATLQIAGTISNSGSFDASNGTIEMNGSSAQTIPANTLVSNSLNNLIISNSSTGVTLGGTLNLYGTLSFGAVNSKTFSTGGYLTLKSSATGTAGVADLTNNGSTSGNTITGNVTVERYISAAKKWRFLSIPTSSTQTIQAAWQEGCGANLNCVPNFGTQITGTGGTPAGFDVYTSPPSMKTYNPVTNGWTAIPNTNAALINNLSNNTVAYLIFIRGDRSATTTSSPVTSTVLRTTGVIKQGTQSAVTIAAPATAYTAVGNPYPSRIDLTKMTPAPTTATKIYVWDPFATSGSAYGYGAYQTLTYNGTNFTVTPGGGSYGAPYNQNPNYIESGEAFFVGGNASAYNITFKENIKASGNNLVFFAASNPQYAEANLFINNNGVTTLMDGARADISSVFSNSVDDNDAFKIANSTENVSLKRDGQLLSVERHNSITSADTFYLNLGNVRVQNYEWQLNMNNLDQPGLTGFLEDNYLHTSTPLSLNGSTVVNFSIANIPGSYAADRFRIVFMPAAVLPLTITNVKAYRKINDIAVEWSVENESNLKQYEVEKSADGNVFAIAYTVAANNAALSNYKWLDVQPLAGNNYYRIRSTDINMQTVYSNIVKVNMGKVEQTISIYPNPVINGMINLQLNNQPTGIYGIRMLNKSGQVIMERKVQHTEGSSTETIHFNKYLPHGIYQLEVNKPDDTQSTINVIY